MSEERCGNCRFCHVATLPEYLSGGEILQLRSCHRRSPANIGPYTWPTVEPKDWCGEWEMTKEEQDQIDNFRDHAHRAWVNNDTEDYFSIRWRAEHERAWRWFHALVENHEISLSACTCIPVAEGRVLTVEDCPVHGGI